jgi:hypothetical protein
VYYNTVKQSKEVFMILPKLDKYYVSEIDQFLRAVEKATPLSQSQQEEIAKNNRIARLRDDPNYSEKQELI